jgi:polyisoprenoid-binding protein YceI
VPLRPNHNPHARLAERAIKKREDGFAMCHSRFAALCLLVSALFPLPARAQAPAGVPVFQVTPQDSTIKFFVKSSVALEGNFKKWDATFTYTSTDYKTGVLEVKIYPTAWIPGAE